MNFKYIIAEKDGIEHPFLFSKLVYHNVVGQPLITQGFKIVSAGFCKIEPMFDCFTYKGFKFECWGNSTGLKVKFRPTDSEIIEANYNFSCF